MSKSGEVVGGGAAIIWLVFTLVCSVGWCMNAYKFCKLDFEQPYKAEIIRAVSIVVPVVGGVSGWMDIGEENDKPKK